MQISHFRILNEMGCKQQFTIMNYILLLYIHFLERCHIFVLFFLLSDNIYRINVQLQLSASEAFNRKRV